MAHHSAQRSFECCPDCDKHIADTCGTILIDERFDWCVRLVCGSCKAEWAFCCECSRVRKVFDEKRISAHELTRHDRIYHQVASLQNQASHDSFISNDNDTIMEDTVTMTEDNWMDLIKANSQPANFRATRKANNGENRQVISKRMSRFLSHGNGNISSGIEYLVARALQQVSNTSQANYHPHDVLQMMRLMLLYKTSSPANRELLASFLDGIVNQPEIDEHEYARLDLPTSLSDMRPLFSQGKWAIAPNFPMPMGKDINGHAYYSLFHQVGYLLQMGFSIEPLVDVPKTTEVTRILESKRARTIRADLKRANADANRLSLGLVLWTDDCDPFNLINKNSVWVFATTFAVPHSRLQTSDNTMLTALGRKGQDHQPVWDEWRKEYSQLSNPNNNYWFYYAPLGRNIRVCLQLLAIEQDCPERRSQLGMAGSNGATAARWRWSANVSQVWDKLGSCDACFERRVSGRNETMDTECESGVCADWNMNTSSHVLDYTPPSSYPPSMLLIEGENNKLSPREQDLDILKNITDIAMEGYSDSEFTKTEAQTFMKDCGISEKEAKRATDAVDDDNIDGYRYPPLWLLGMSLFLYMDVIMHLLCLGVIKRFMKHMSRKWMRLQHKHTEFCRLFGNVTKRVKQYYRPWCKVRAYGDGKFGGFISDHFLAHARLLRWEYSMLPELASQDYVEPKPGQRWYRRDYDDWLRAHGQSTEGKMPDVKARVQRLKTQVGGPPPIVPIRGGPVENVTNVFIALVAVMSIVMVSAVTPDICLEMDQQIKIFLSLCLKLDNEIRGSGDDPFFVGKNNFLSMLNLPALAAMYGPLRLYWEGGGKGEGFLRLLKPLIVNLKAGWALCVGERFYLNKTFKWLFGAETASSEAGYFVYKTLDSLESAFIIGDVMAGVVMKSLVDPNECESLFLVSKTEVWELALNGAPVSRVLGASYFGINIASKMSMADWKVLCHGYGIVRECLLLPKLHRSGSFAHLVRGCADFQRATFYIIGSDWKEVVRDGTFQLPLYQLVTL